MKKSLVLAVAPLVVLAELRPPGAERAPIRGNNGAAILPGGRVLQPLGQQFPTGPGPVNVIITGNDRFMASANIGPERGSVTVFQRNGKQNWTLGNVFASEFASQPGELRSVSGGIALANEKQAWISEGESGRVRLLDLASGTFRRTIGTNDSALALTNNFSGALAFDRKRNLLFIADPFKRRIVGLDVEKQQIASRTELGLRPNALSLDPSGLRLWVAGSGDTSEGSNGPIACVLDVANISKPSVAGSIRHAGNSYGILATAEAVYISDAKNDEVLAVNPSTLEIQKSMPLRVEGLADLRGLIPKGLAYDDSHHWLLAAAAGVNAVAVLDPRRGAIGLLPAGWFPTALAAQDGVAVVANKKGRGSGPSTVFVQSDYMEFFGVFHRGSLTRFEIPPEQELRRQTTLVLEANGFRTVAGAPWPEVPVQHVVLIVKSGETFDEVLGDIKASNGGVSGMAKYARFGDQGYADGGKRRFSLQGISVTPNQHSLAERWAFSDNFYAGSAVLADGYEAEADMPETVPRHLEQAGVSYLGLSGSAETTIQAVDNQFREKEKTLPGVLVVNLRTNSSPGPGAYPYEASRVAQEDQQVGQVVEYLSHSRWWREMAIFIVGDEVQTGADHIEAERGVVICAGPYFRKNFVSHLNTAIPSIWKTVFHLLKVPPLNLFDASACDFRDLLTTEANSEPFTAVPADSRLFENSSRR